MMEIEGLKPKQDVEPSNIGKRSFAQGYMPPGLGKRVKPERPKFPNRRWRRMELALAPRSIRVLAKINRVTYKFAHQKHRNSVERWLDPEEYQAYLEYAPETQAHIQRQIKNTVRRKRQEV